MVSCGCSLVSCYRVISAGVLRHTLGKKMHIEIIAARYAGEYKIDISFSDATQRQVDFGPFLILATNPMTRRYLDVNHFRQFRVVDGELDWNDYELCFPVSQLHAGKISSGC